jgi:hypothetical protein
MVNGLRLLDCKEVGDRFNQTGMEAQIPAYGSLSAFFYGALGPAGLAPRVALSRYSGSGGNSEPKSA